MVLMIMMFRIMSQNYSLYVVDICLKEIMVYRLKREHSATLCTHISAFPCLSHTSQTHSRVTLQMYAETHVQ